jgi:hypothetical protein
MTRTRTVGLVLSRTPFSGPLRRDLLEEAANVAKKLRPVLAGYRLGAMLYALLIVASEYTNKLLNVEMARCDCVADRNNGLYKRVSHRQHALTKIEENSRESS